MAKSERRGRICIQRRPPRFKIRIRIEVSKRIRKEYTS